MTPWFSSSSRNGRRRRSSYRSSRSVARRQQQQQHPPWTKFKICLVLTALLVVCIFTLSPMLILSSLEQDLHAASHTVVGPLSALVHKRKNEKKQDTPKTVEDTVKKKIKEASSKKEPVEEKKEDPSKKQPDEFEEDLTLARGVSGLPWSQTPALHGAKRAHIECDENVDSLAYWNVPQGLRDREFKTPFEFPKNRFLTFEPDPGGWNNIRMSMETLVVLAAATGRTLVLPPKAPFYLLGIGEENARSFGNFFSFEKAKQRVNIITMEEFLQQEGESLLGLSSKKVKELMTPAKMCIYNPNSKRTCESLYVELRKTGVQPEMEGAKHCLVFSEPYLKQRVNLTKDEQKRVERFCGVRKPVIYDSHLHDPPLLHWQAANLNYRLLNHFYSFLYFLDPIADNYYKRFVRDFLHYCDLIFCVAGKIVNALGENFSSLHVRRGDLQYKEVKIPAEEWYNNSKEVWNKGELLYIATDERNKTWFEPISSRHPVKFLDDYWEMAGLAKLDPTWLGMIDTIVASRGRTFVGTWHSTFSGYINRMRGYHGMSMKDSWYSFMPRKYVLQEWDYPHGNYPAREFSIAWVGIDGDSVIEHELTPVNQENKIKSVADGKAKEEKVPEAKEKVSKTRRKLTLADLKEDVGFADKPMARGIAGLPMSETPALEGGSRASIKCDVNVDSLAYWNDPQGTRDVNFQSPFKVTGDTKYISFSPDAGGWNNVRMSLEIIFVIAAATGRTVVLPPEQPLYLLKLDKKKEHRGFADFFPLHTSEFQKRVPVISMEEFIQREGGKDGRLPVPDDENKERVLKAASNCIVMRKHGRSCFAVYDYLSQVGFVPQFGASHDCVVFDEDVYNGKNMTTERRKKMETFCGPRNINYLDSKWDDPVLIHFQAGEKEEKDHRLLTHYYIMLHFTNPVVDHYFKRFVRDFFHYHDSIYCAAGKIVKAIQAEGADRGFPVDDEGSGGYSAMHIRRGDFQFKKVKLPAEEWYNNTKELWQPNEILYIATDERNKTWFDPIARHYDLRFLDDYWDLAGVGKLDPNYLGMIDTIVASRARIFAGTWFSTFTGYINRMRGHHGMTMMDSWYSFLPKKTAVHEWKNVTDDVYAYEFPLGWIGIDGDVPPNGDIF